MNAQQIIITGNTIFGGPGYDLGACSLYYGDATPLQLTGTVDNGTNANEIVGTGTEFLSELEPGMCISFSTSPTANVYMVTQVSSDTALKVHRDITEVLTNSNIYLVRLISLGDTSDISLKFKLNKTDLKAIQKGDNPIDRVVIGYEMTLETELTSPAISRIAYVLSGIDAEIDPTTGQYKNLLTYLPLGSKDSDNAKRLYLVRIRDGVESSDPLDTFTIFKACAEVDAEFKFDASSQRMFKVTFYCYPEQITYKGKKINAFGYAGTL